MAVDAATFGPAPKSNLFASLWGTTNQDSDVRSASRRPPRVTRLPCSEAHPLL